MRADFLFAVCVVHGPWSMVRLSAFCSRVFLVDSHYDRATAEKSPPESGLICLPLCCRRGAFTTFSRSRRGNISLRATSQRDRSYYICTATGNTNYLSKCCMITYMRTWYSMTYNSVLLGLGVVYNCGSRSTDVRTCRVSRIVSHNSQPLIDRKSTRLNSSHVD